MIRLLGMSHTETDNSRQRGFRFQMDSHYQHSTLIFYCMVYLRSIFYQHVSIDNYYSLPVSHVQFNRILLAPSHYTEFLYDFEFLYILPRPFSIVQDRKKKHANKYNIQEKFSML